VGQLGQMGLGILGVQRLQDFAGPPVQRRSLTRRNLLIQGVPDQGVREAEAAEPARHLGENAGGHGFFQHIGDSVIAGLRHPFQGSKLKLASEHRRLGEQRHTPIRQVAQPARDDLPKPLGDPEVRRGRIHGISEAPLDGEEPNDLSDEQRVSLRLPKHGGSQLRRRRAFRGPLNEIPDLRLG
jgi:hypothetical protein